MLSQIPNPFFLPGDVDKHLVFWPARQQVLLHAPGDGRQRASGERHQAVQFLGRVRKSMRFEIEKEINGFLLIMLSSHFYRNFSFKSRWIF